MGSSSGVTGLALLRLDRVAEFDAKGISLTAAGVEIRTNMADVTRLMPKIPAPL